MSDKNPTPDEAKPERIAKRIARSGVCSRRDAERMIEEGLVKLNGKVLDTPAVTVTDEDEIYVNGKPLPEKEKPRLWRLFKKRGLVTSHRDEQGRDTVFEHLPSYVPRVISVGRLDLNSEGLLLLTNDGELARYLELPATGWARRYRVRVHGRIEPEKLKQLEDGVTVDGIQYGSIHAEVDVQKDSNAWMTVTLREGKNREIRRVMEHLGWPVTRLMRVSYGPFQLGSLAPGDCEEITGKVMKEQLAAFFKGDYSKVSEKKSVARGGTARPKAPRTVFGQPAQRKRPQGGPGANPPNADDAEEQRDSRARSGSDRPASDRPGSARSGKPRIGAAPRANVRSRPTTRDDRFEREERDERGGNARPTNKGRGRYSTEGKSGGKTGGSTGGPRSRSTGGRDTDGRSGGSGRDGGRDSGRGGSGRDSRRENGRDSNKRDGSGFSNARNKPLRQSSGGRSGNAGTSTPGRKPAGNRPKARKD
ncbi:MAG: pseudouridine synthase [Rhodospirillales bacterium]|nr:pseudouridine synthase [Rhodospirillales bacterium]